MNHTSRVSHVWLECHVREGKRKDMVGSKRIEIWRDEGILARYFTLTRYFTLMMTARDLNFRASLTQWILASEVFFLVFNLRF